MEKNIAVIKGDGIGPEIVTESMKVLDKVAEKFGHKFNYTQLLMGGCSIDANGVPLTDETIAACKASDAVLMGSIGGDTTTSPWYKLPANLRPEAGLLGIRKALGAKERYILAQFVIEAGVTSALGGLIGIALGYLLSAAASQVIVRMFQQQMRVQPSINSVLLSFGISAGIGVFFGFMPAKKAAKLNPIDALRYD